jgi:hypothetical protein
VGGTGLGRVIGSDEVTAGVLWESSVSRAITRNAVLTRLIWAVVSPILVVSSSRQT